MFQQIHIAGGKFKGPGIMESSQEIHRASGYFRGPGNLAQLIYRASSIDRQQIIWAFARLVCIHVSFFLF